LGVSVGGRAFSFCEVVFEITLLCIQFSGGGAFNGKQF
jgi:hypothetical protein